ncbi:uncharacterized protein YukE [Actinoplanes lutulentus]|uniref:Excreted virulence factor EspC (Type VII ESX diderm) n=1 Tax=Actinoplanes lutulentus TaxID=1287878 RepID=A0A327ZJV5_9ACTN|nr:hypothetical protein [Actinoplanes lutulentus]MBB2940632.1 uncharacterized protein YukE [Actinoplanes lutulentus]RAK42943.1 hypothetical protein B0I29_10173 [Actinoplanes lutulentus]
MSEAYLGWPGLIAEERTTKAYEGTGIFESASGMVDNAFSGDVPGFAGNALATGLAAMGAVMDPLQVVFAAGVGWLMEHVAILREPLDKLMGDPKAIDAHAQSWKNIEQRIYDATDFFVEEVNRTTVAWTAASADAYRQRARSHAESIQAMGKLADGMGRATTALGATVGIARNTVRDIVAEVVGACISKAVQAVSVVLIPKVVAEISILVSAASLKIFTVVKQLFAAIKNTGLLVRQMQALMSRIGQSSRNVLRLEAHRIEAVGTAGEGWRGAADAYRLLSQGHVRAHGAVDQVMVNTARAAAQGNTSQNTGSGASDMNRDNPAPPPIDLEPER